MAKLDPRTWFRNVSLEAKSFRLHKEAASQVSTSPQWTDKQAHPSNMDKYDDLCNDPETSIALDLLADMIAGVGFHTEMPEDTAKTKDNSEKEKPVHKHQKVVDEWSERVNADEKFKQVTKAMLGKGFQPVEVLPDFGLKLLPPESFYIWRDKYGRVYRYTQEVGGSEVARWQISGIGEQLRDVKEAYTVEEFKVLEYEAEQPARPLTDIVLFINDEDTSNPYGRSLVDSISGLIEARQQINVDLPAAIHRFAYPLGVLWGDKPLAEIRKAFEDRGSDDWVSIGNAKKDEINYAIIEAAARQDWIPFVELIYYQIGEALHAPLLLLLKNATEASANTMLESVERFVDGRQRYIKRRVEKYFWEPQVGEPVPRLVWGQPTTGLEEITLDQVAALYTSGAIKFNQAQDLLEKLGVELVEPEFPKEPVQFPMMQPTKKPLPVPQELLAEKLNDLGLSLDTIYNGYREKHIPLIKAMQLGGKTIEVYLARAYGKDTGEYERERELKFYEWSRRLVGESAKPTYRVSVE